MTAQGHKADGLAQLPALWVPDYVVIDDVLAAALNREAAGSPTELAAGLSTSEVADGLRALFTKSRDGVLVRSSAPTEDISARGLYESRAVGFASFITTAEAATHVWSHAARVRPDNPQIPLIVQRRISGLLLGHLSNERRLREDRRDWVVELRGPLSEVRTHGMRAVRADRRPLGLVLPTCSSPDELREVLRRVAGALTHSGTRYHLEWVWDGERLWLVQADPILDFRSPEPRDTRSAELLPLLRTFRPADAHDVGIPKLKCVTDYASLDLPRGDLRVLRDADVLRGLLAEQASTDLLFDLEALAGANAVIRTDVRSEGRDFDLLRPRTETGWSATRMLSFLIQTTRSLVANGIAAADIAFITHPFIPADGSAWSVAAPTASRVRIDATFGLPDGLLYYSHDSYEVDLRTGSVRRHVRCKSPILLCNKDGAWRDHALGSPWDWRSSLSDNEALAMARMSKRLADYLESPVEIMFLVRAHLPTEPDTILPWVHLTESVGSIIAAPTESHFPSRVLEIRAARDLALLDEAARQFKEEGRRFLVRVQPEGSLLHDAGFLENLIAHCSPDMAVIELAGSTLSHAYYALTRAGLQVRAIDPIVPGTSPPLEFGKLVRDLIPANIAAKGERVRAYYASGEELEHLLKQKILEEALEVAASTSTAELMEELGDVIDVLSALCAISGTDLATLIRWAADKRRERGGFEHGVVLVDTRERSLEEAVSSSSATYSVAPEFGIEIERGRTGNTTSFRLELGHELRVPLQAAFGQAAVVTVAGVEYELRFEPPGLVLNRADSQPSPGQMTLDV